MFTEADMIISYSRADAIRDGVLVDVSEMARECGFVIPVAVTSAVFGYIEPPEVVRDWQSVEGRLWDLLSMLRFAAKKARGELVQFEVYFQNGPGEQGEVICFKALCGPGDQGEPVVTVMMQEED